MTGAAGPAGRGPAAAGPPRPPNGPRISAIPDGEGPDPETLRRARQIAARLAVPRPRRDVTARRGVGELASVRYRGGSDDIDLDRTVAQLVEHPLPDEDDIIVRERVRTRRSVLLLVDVSGSMRGERVRTAAATVGALAAELSRDDLAVVAFWSDAAVLSRLGQHVPPQVLLDTMLRIPAKGLTNIAWPLQVAARELAGSRPATRGRCCCPTACTTPVRTRGRSRPGCRGWTCCSTPRASRTPNSPASWPASATDGCGGSAATPTSRPPWARSSPIEEPHVSVVVVATIVPRPEHRDEVIATITETVAKVHEEDGCELYALHQADDRLVMVEKWASADALRAHSRGAALAAQAPMLAGKLAGPAEVIVLQAVPAGDPAKGQL